MISPTAGSEKQPKKKKSISPNKLTSSPDGSIKANIKKLAPDSNQYQIKIQQIKEIQGNLLVKSNKENVRCVDQSSQEKSKL